MQSSESWLTADIDAYNKRIALDGFVVRKTLPDGAFLMKEFQTISDLFAKSIDLLPLKWDNESRVDHQMSKMLRLVCHTQSVEFVEQLMESGHLAIDSSKGHWRNCHERMALAYDRLKEKVGCEVLWCVKAGDPEKWIEDKGDYIMERHGIKNYDSAIRICLEVPEEFVFSGSITNWIGFVNSSHIGWLTMAFDFDDDRHDTKWSDYNRDYEGTQYQHIVTFLKPEWIVDIVFPKEESKILAEIS